jgi:hypothetical protein
MSAAPLPNLFDTLPPTLFAPLTAPTRRLYAAALLRLYDLAQGAFVVEDAAATEAVLDVLAATDPDERDALAQEIAPELAALEEEADPRDTARQQRRQARAMLRRLANTGWLVREPQRDFSVHWTLPEYTFPLLESFRRVLERRPAEFEGLIYSTYRLVHKPEAAVSGYALLQQAHEQTRQIITGLKQLQHNIGSYIERVIADYGVREVLANFAAYQGEIAPNYHRLKTADHVARYRLDILRTIRGWRDDPQWLDAATAEARQRRPDLSPEVARRGLVEQLLFIARQFEQMDTVTGLIDERHSRYAEATVSQVQYQLGAGRDLRRQLVDLCRHLGAGRANASDPAPAEFAALFHLYTVDYLTARSLYTPPQARSAYQPPPLAGGVPDPTLLATLRAALEAERAQQITPARVWAYLAPHLAEQTVVESADLPLAGLEDWLLLLGLRVFAETPDSPYQLLDPPPTRPWASRGAFRYPNFQIARREVA